MPACPECGGELKFDRSRFMYVCRACGLSLTRTEYDHVSRSRRAEAKAVDEREQLRRDYLRWWLSSKK